MTQTTKAQLATDLAGNFPSTGQGKVSAEDIRTFITNLLDSYSHLDDIRREVLSANSLCQTLTDQASITWDADDGLVAKVTLAGNRTMGFPSNLEEGARITLFVIQDAIGSRTLSWNAKYNFEGGAPTLSTAAGSVDKFDFIAYDNGGTIVALDGNGGLVPIS